MHIEISIDNILFRKIFLFDNSIAKKYKTLVQDLIKNNGLDFDNRRSFYTYKSIFEIEKDLDNAIQFINNFFKTKLLPDDKSDPNFFNILHEKFEILNNGYNEQTVLKMIWTHDLREKIRDLNFCVHQLEHGIEKMNQVNIQWNKETTKRVPLDNNDYTHATDVYKSNYVYLGYNEVGKSILDIYHDNLPIDYPGMKNNHFIGPDIVFCNEDRDLFDNNFTQWCRNNKINPYDKQSGLLNYPIGMFETYCLIENFTSNSKITAFDIVDK